jgi:hypothetical protein
MMRYNILLATQMDAPININQDVMQSWLADYAMRKDWKSIYITSHLQQASRQMLMLLVATPKLTLRLERDVKHLDALTPKKSSTSVAVCPNLASCLTLIGNWSPVMREYKYI